MRLKAVFMMYKSHLSALSGSLKGRVSFDHVEDTLFLSWDPPIEHPRDRTCLLYPASSLLRSQNSLAFYFGFLLQAEKLGESAAVSPFKL